MIGALPSEGNHVAQIASHSAYREALVASKRGHSIDDHFHHWLKETLWKSPLSL